jgi:hypothetical protein
MTESQKATNTPLNGNFEISLNLGNCLNFIGMELLLRLKKRVIPKGLQSQTSASVAWLGRLGLAWSVAKNRS